jgi:hypothetical protein
MIVDTESIKSMRSPNMRLKTDFDPRADFGIFLVSRLVMFTNCLAFGEGRVKAA